MTALGQVRSLMGQKVMLYSLTLWHAILSSSLIKKWY